MNVIKKKKQRQVTLVYATKACEVGEVHLQSLLTSALDGRKWSVSRPRLLYRGKKRPFPTEKELAWAPESLWTFMMKGNISLPLLGMSSSPYLRYYTDADL